MKARMKESSLERSYAKAKVWRDRLQLWEELNKSRPLAQLQLPSQADLIGWARVEDEIMLWTARVVDHRIIREEQVYWMGENVDEAILHWLAIRSPRPEQVVIGPESGTDLGRLGLAQYTSVAIEKWLARSALLALRKRRASEALASRTLNPKAGLLELQEKLEMSSYPHRIECFDISNLGSQATVASMSVMLEGEAAASQTRRFKIQSASQDDYGSLNEALSRRVKRWETQSKGFQSRPDILLIDGGVGQARAVMEAVKPWLELGTQLWGLAKEEEVLHHPSGQTVQLGPTSHGRRLLQQIRDQTHHRAVSYHRLLREKAAWG
jgi:excinuclease ABC subunit C